MIMNLNLKPYASIILCMCLSTNIAIGSDSKRIEVYSISQNYWDVQAGDTLSQIIKQLLPYNPAMRKSLSKEVVSLNPGAFIQNNPDMLKANTRLWLPNNAPKKTSTPDHSKYDVKSFSWGHIRTPK